LIDLPIIQILINIQESLAEYYKKVKGKNYDLLWILDLPIDFSDCCPICDGVDCARFIEYYVRKVTDENGTFYKRFPIARYICQRKGKKKIFKHKTFSLLPYQLVPYSQYSIPFIIKCLTLRCIEGLSISKFQDYVAGLNEHKILFISADQLLEFKAVVREAISKIMATKYYPDFGAEGFEKGTDQGLLIYFLDFVQYFECLKVEPSIRGPCGLGYDFYLRGGGYFKNAYFLFGTPSQFR
jgi:hypothetical protein